VAWFPQVSQVKTSVESRTSLTPKPMINISAHPLLTWRILERQKLFSKEYPRHQKGTRLQEAADRRTQVQQTAGNSIRSVAMPPLPVVEQGPVQVSDIDTPVSSRRRNNPSVPNERSEL
jgi:hypothetical protein